MSGTCISIRAPISSRPISAGCAPSSTAALAARSSAPSAAPAISCVRIRLLHTESFRLAAIYIAVFAVSVLVLGVSVLAVTERAMRDQIIQYSQADIAAINDGYVHQGLHEAREVTLQQMAALGHADFILLQR